MYADCELSDAAFMAAVDALAVVDGDEVNCNSTDGQNHLAFSSDPPVIRRESNGLFSVRFACQDAEAAFQFHSRYQFEEVFLGLGRDMLGPMLLAPLASANDCGALFGFSEAEARRFCASVHAASAGRVICQDTSADASTP